MLTRIFILLERGKKRGETFSRPPLIDVRAKKLLSLCATHKLITKALFRLFVFLGRFHMWRQVEFNCVQGWLMRKHTLAPDASDKAGHPVELTRNKIGHCSQSSIHCFR